MMFSNASSIVNIIYFNVFTTERLYEIFLRYIIGRISEAIKVRTGVSNHMK